MKKPLSERVAINQSEKKTKRPSAKTAFISLKDDIKEALDAGWSMKAVWETLTDEGKIVFSYKSFRHYVLKLIKPEQEKIRDEIKQESKSSSSMKSFNYDPIPKPEDLL